MQSALRTLQSSLVAIALLAFAALPAFAQEAQTSDATAPDLRPTGEAPLPDSAEAFRNHFDLLFQEHTYLAGATTEALVNGRRDEYLAAQAMLNANGVEISREVGALYGPANEAMFFQGWKRHIQDYEMYAQGAMAGTDSQKQQARNDLDAYVAEAQGFFRSVNPDAPADRLGAALADHVHGTLDVIDAQAAKDVSRAYTLGRQGAMMTATDLADPLALAIVQQFPDRFAGDSEAGDAGFVRQTSLLVQADTLLGGAALSAGVMGRQPEVDAITGVLDQNTTDLMNLVGPRLAAGGQEQLGSLWRAKQAALMDYAKAVPGNDSGARQQANQSLVTFRQDLDALFAPSGIALGERFISQATYVMSALDAIGMKDIGTAKAYLGGAAKQSEEIGVRLAMAAAAHRPA